MKVYVLITNDDLSECISGVYSSKEAVISALTSAMQTATLDRVEVWDVDNGFIDDLKISKKTTITIED